MLAADYVIDLGPGAGERGGELLAAGTPQEVISVRTSLTGKFLSGERSVATPKERRQPKTWLKIEHASLYNLKDVSLALPLGVLACMSGVSGSGKSTLVMDVLVPRLTQLLSKRGRPTETTVQLSGWEQLDKVICVDQTPIGRAGHSNPATYIGLFNPLRELFAQTQEARVRGYGPERFSFNVKGGRCEACEGNGVVAVEMHFLPDLQVVCDVCRFVGGTLHRC
jgi:excinuclease ABC subunit A